MREIQCPVHISEYAG